MNHFLLEKTVHHAHCQFGICLLIQVVHIHQISTHFVVFHLFVYSPPNI